MSDIDWGNPYLWNDAQWASASWAERFILINPYFWRYLVLIPR